jgi:glycosyltransferase involved in cell wall biosynthesis
MIVAVVVPLFNKVDHVGRCLRSVLAQTYAELDVVVIDDGSSDGSEKVVASIGDRRVRLIQQANAGVSAARNRGVSASDCEWVFFIDADDEWAPNLVESLMALLKSHPEAGVLASPTERVYANGGTVIAHLADTDFVHGSAYLRDYFASFVSLGQSPFSNSSFAVRRAVFERLGGYKVGVRLTEDSDLWVRLALATPIAMIRPALARYYIEVTGNTRMVAQREEFEVVKTLTGLLKADKVPTAQRGSAQALLVLQKLMLVRRQVLLRQRGHALKGLIDWVIWRKMPLHAAMALVAALVPDWGLHLAMRLKRSWIADHRSGQ